jgi:glycosyltransferase involved in cell wall biosynthesis
MTRQTQWGPPIPVVELEVNRPVWSVMIPTYNCASFLRATLDSVLQQDPGPELMQIEVVDDHSTADDPEAVVREVAGDRVAFHRQPRNTGHTANFNTCLARSRGHLVHLLHGDDLVRPGFYATAGRILKRHPEVGAAFCRYIVVDELDRWRTISAPPQDYSGLLRHALRTIASMQPIQTVATIVRRSVYEEVGGFASSIRYCGEDWEMWMRIAARHRIWYEAEPLACYRVHDASLTGTSVRTAANTRELEDVIAMASRYFPQDEAHDLVALARRHTALWALQLAGDLLASGDRRGARRQIAQAVRLSRAPQIVGRAVYLASCVAASAVGLRTG